MRIRNTATTNHDVCRMKYCAALSIKFIRESIKVIKGVQFYKKLEKKFGRDTFFINIHGATGDVYIQLMLVDCYLRQNHITKYILLGSCPSFLPLCRLFGISDRVIIQISDGEKECLQKAVLFSGDKSFQILFLYFWHGTTYFNCCRVRMLDRFNFMDTYYLISFGLHEPVEQRLPVFSADEAEVVSRCAAAGIRKGKTVFISPDANSVTTLPAWFWNLIIRELRNLGFSAVVNSSKQDLYDAPVIFPPYSSIGTMLEYGGYFLGIRSGICDIISSAECRKIILYPQIQPEIDLGEHRTEMEFCSLQLMGLSDGRGLTEISTPLILNITDKDRPLLSGIGETYKAFSELKERIIGEFRNDSLKDGHKPGFTAR